MKIYYSFLGWFIALDSFSLMMLLIVNLSAILSAAYFVGQAKKPMHYAAFFILLLGLNSIFISTDLISIFILLEITCFAAYFMSGKALGRYLFPGAIGSFMMLAGIIGLLISGASLNIAETGKFLIGATPNKFHFYCFIVFVSGILIKMLFMPLRLGLVDMRWVVGLYIFLRLVFWFMCLNPLSLVILKWLGICFMLLGAFLAIGQFSIKKMFVYFSLSNVGCILFGLSLVSPLSLIGALFHLLNYVLFCQLMAYSAEIKGGDKNSFSWIGFLSNAGIAPLNGFWGRAMIVIAAYQAQQSIGAVTVIFSATIMLACPFKLRKYPSLIKSDAFQEELGSPYLVKFAVIALAFICVAGGLFAMPVINKIIKPAAGVLFGI